MMTGVPPICGTPHVVTLYSHWDGMKTWLTEDTEAPDMRCAMPDWKQGAVSALLSNFEYVQIFGWNSRIASGPCSDQAARDFAFCCQRNSIQNIQAFINASYRHLAAMAEILKESLHRCD